MKNYSLLFISIFFISIFVIGCNKDEIPFDKNNILLGNWEFTVSSEEPTHTVYHMVRTKLFSEKYRSINFSNNGNYSEMGSFGFAGQPCLYTGTWTSINDTLLQINIESPFTSNHKLSIKLLNEMEMDYYYIYD